MKLQILIPQWKEQDEDIKPLLDSIELQQGVNLKQDVGVIIVNDGSDIYLSHEFLSKYSFDIKYYLNEHKGVSATRNACLDYATADYIMFCDADDMFYAVTGLFMIMQNIEKGFDTFTSNFMEELKSEENTFFIEHRDDNTFVHGKVHRRQYLIDNNIRWQEELTLHEDGYFNTLCRILTDSYVYCETPFYLWRWNSASITRSTPSWSDSTYQYFILSQDKLVSELAARYKFSSAQFYATSAIYSAYFTMNRPYWLDCDNVEHLVVLKNIVKNFHLKYEALWKTAPQEVKSRIWKELEDRSIPQGFIPVLTFDQWLQFIVADTKG